MGELFVAVLGIWLIAQITKGELIQRLNLI
jgi:hypothetical protein